MDSRRFRILAGLAVVIALTGLYFYFYQAAPLPPGVNDIVVSAMTVAASALAAAMSYLILRDHGRGAPPRAIWLYFTLALLGWFLGEALWMMAYFAGGEAAAEWGAADILWILSYFFFAASLYRQYNLIFRPEKRQAASFLVLAILATLLFAYLYGIWLGGADKHNLSLLVFTNAFYVMGDIALSIGALVVARAFHSGALARPWYGLLLFSLSDLLYAQLDARSAYAWSVEQGNLLTTITDTTYFAAYLFIAFGCYLQVILLNYGPRLKHDH
ncbi:MAG: hypothetical protein HFACDABA_01305 [Anaerolineales bacterium]|nr:hypothetical protein [Anaerolineales bacterium]